MQMKQYSQGEPTVYKQALKEYHKHSDRHVLVLEADISYQEACKCFHYADLERKAGNELVSMMRDRYLQLMRTKKYRKVRSLYGQASTGRNTQECKRLAAVMNEMQRKYQVTWNDCRKAMIPIGKKYGIDAVFALTKAEDIWRAMERCLYSDGRTLHFSKRGELPNIRAKQPNRGIIFSVKDGTLRFRFAGMSFGVHIKDRFERDEVNAMLKYLSNPEIKDRQAVQTMLEDGVCISTYRPCYASLVCHMIRGKLRVYVHIIMNP